VAAKLACRDATRNRAAPLPAARRSAIGLSAPSRRTTLRSSIKSAPQGAASPSTRAPALQALYGELAARDQELSRLRARLGGLRAFAFGGDPASAGERRPFDLMAAVEAALRLAQSELRGVIVCQRIQPLDVHGSLAGITQVLVHLFTNAATAMRDTGRPAIIHIDAARLGARALLRVSDNGCGIAPEAMRRIFEPFFSTAGAGLGLGLGLTISSAIVRAHGGRLTCGNRRPHGARFCFDLPCPGTGTCGAGPAPDRRLPDRQGAA
jgi:C4-dicarboxylate-specific signal transduction histidine kinase